jgi:hypothetical protein
MASSLILLSDVAGGIDGGDDMFTGLYNLITGLSLQECLVLEHVGAV